MLQYLILLFFYLGIQTAKSAAESGSDSDDAGRLVSALRNDANLDLSMDEDYEDLRAELLAYHTALSSLPKRRSLITTPCWALGGICINHKLCVGHRYLTEVPGCKSRLNVCCFAWNYHLVQDLSDKGIENIRYPWTHPQEFGGKGVIFGGKEEGEGETDKRMKFSKKLSGNKTKPKRVLLRENKVIIV